MQYLGYEGQAPAPVLAGLDELLNLVSDLGSGIVADETSRAVQDSPVAQVVYFGFDLLDASAQPRGKPGSVEHRGGIPMKEHEDVPSQKRPDVALYEPRNGGSQDPFKIVQTLDRPLRRIAAHSRTHTETAGPHRSVPADNVASV
jgi:hypothetical protein